MHFNRFILVEGTISTKENHAVLFKVNSGEWVGAIDTSRIIVHDETPQFIDHGDSRYTTKKVFGVSGERCETLTKSNRESVTVQPFSSLDGRTHQTQVIFSGSGHSNHMAPAVTEKIKELLISVNSSGCSDHTTLLAAYKNMDRVLTEEGIKKPIIIIADGHSSRFDEKVLIYLVQFPKKS